MPQSELPGSARSRQATQAETRESVLAAAAELFAARGFAAVSVADIAAAAGYSVGAIYSNFENKDELFLAVVDHRIGEHISALVAAYAEAATPESGLTAVADLFEERLHTMADWNLSLIEFTVRGRHNDDLRRELSERHQAARTNFAATIRAVAADRDHVLPSTPEVIASALLGVGSGLVLERLLDPDAPTAAAYRHTLFHVLGVPEPTDGGSEPRVQ